MKNRPKSLLLFTFSALLLLQACAGAPTPETPTMTENAQSEPLPVEEFVRQGFIGGVPYEETRNNYNESDVPVLLEMLANPDEELHWANIVITLNITGDEDVAGPIINFINDGSERPLSQPHYAAKTSALTSFGYLINHTGSDRALTYLIESLDPAVWQERPQTGISPFQTTLEETYLDLSKNAILGLALSGNPGAAGALRTLLESDLTGQQATFRDNNLETIREAITTNEQIAEIGLVNYYHSIRQ